MANDFEFDDIERLQRRPDIEGKEGTVVDFPDAPDGTRRWMRVLAATDKNPKWKAQSEILGRELTRLRNAEASLQRIRDFLAQKFAECCVIEWGGWKSKGVEIPLSVKACAALLRAADDVYDIVDGVVWESKNFRGERLKAVVDEAGN